jgi:hypothetical protein
MAEIWIDDFHQAADGDDWLPAFNRAQAMHGNYGQPGAPPPAPYLFRGFTLRFQARTYHFSGPIEVRCPLALVGSGGLASYGGTILSFPKGSRGIIVHGANTIRHPKFAAVPDPDGTSSGAGTIIEKLMLLAVDPATGAEASRHILFDQRQSTRRPMAGAHGITLFANAVLRDVGISHFDGHGLYIYGLGSGADPTVPGVAAMAALTQAQNMFITGCGGDGIHIFGNDANVCTFIGVQTVNGYGWGVRDLSRLGQNSFIGCQSAYNALGGICRPYALWTMDFDGLAQLLTEDIAHKDGLIAEWQAKLAEPGLDAAELADITTKIAITTEQRAQEARLVPVLPDAIAAARAAMLAAFDADPAGNPAPPDVAHFGDLATSVDGWDAKALWQRLAQYHASLVAEPQLIAAEVDRRLAAAGQAPSLEHMCVLIFDNPYGAGGDLFVSYYAESNGLGAGETHQISVANMCLNSATLSNGSEAIGFSNQNMKASIDGAVVAATLGVETPADVAAGRLALASHGGPSGRVAISAAGTLHRRLALADRMADVGSILLNSEPRIGQPIGWVMTQQGWAQFGPISRLPARPA